MGCPQTLPLTDSDEMHPTVVPNSTISFSELEVAQDNVVGLNENSSAESNKRPRLINKNVGNDMAANKENEDVNIQRSDYISSSSSSSSSSSLVLTSITTPIIKSSHSLLSSMMMSSGTTPSSESVHMMMSTSADVNMVTPSASYEASTAIAEPIMSTDTIHTANSEVTLMPCHDQDIDTVMKLLTEPSRIKDPDALQTQLSEYGIPLDGSEDDQEDLKNALKIGFLDKDRLFALSNTLKYVPQQIFLKAFDLSPTATR